MKFFINIVVALIILVLLALTCSQIKKCSRAEDNPQYLQEKAERKEPMHVEHKDQPDVETSEAADFEEPSVNHDTNGLYNAINVHIDSFFTLLNYFADSTIDKLERLDSKHIFESLFDPAVLTKGEVIEVQNIKSGAKTSHSVSGYASSLTQNGYKGAKFTKQSLNIKKSDGENPGLVDVIVHQGFEGPRTRDITEKTFTLKTKLERNHSDNSWIIKIQKITVNAIFGYDDVNNHTPKLLNN